MGRYLTYVCPNTQLQGLAVWDEEAENFVPICREKGCPGYAMQYSGAQWVQLLRPGDEGYAYYASAFANVRVKASFAAIEDPSQYEFFTPCNADFRNNLATRWQRGCLSCVPNHTTSRTFTKSAALT